MGYQLELRHAAQKDLDALGGREYDAVARAISGLEQNPGLSGVKKLAESGLWRIRVRKCRVIYSIDDEAKLVTVVRVARRSEDTYKRL